MEKIKFLGFKGTPAGDASDEEVAMLPVKNFSGMINGGSGKLELYFSGFQPQAFSNTGAGQMDHMKIQFDVDDDKMYEVMSTIAESVSAFVEGDDPVLTVWNGSSSPIHSAMSALVIKVEERT
tara:strand:- start:562 stop:930 length:369 start_codon:yes stop_codon:yes gene_type:complete